MRINWISYYNTADGYGRYSSRFVQALQNAGVEVKPATMEHRDMPSWMQKQEGIDWNALTISALPPYYVKPVAGRHWLLTMIEGTIAPAPWVKAINESGVERVIVPCQHNADAYRNSGVLAPISIVPGGTDPAEFPLLARDRSGFVRPYTFLTIADRGFRKGWEEVWRAFYIAFGGKTTGNQDVRLIIKDRPNGKKSTTSIMASSEGSDQRITYLKVDTQDMYSVYAQADCLVLPSRSEGWGMPHREAASMGIPTIVQRYSGLDDGYTDKWGLVVSGGKIKPIPKENKLSLGEWMVADVDALAWIMEWVFHHPGAAALFGYSASNWIAKNQTWEHSARRLIQLIEGSEHAIPVDSRPLLVPYPDAV